MAGISNADARIEQSCAASTKIGIWSETSNDLVFWDVRLGLSVRDSTSEWENQEVVGYSVNKRAGGGGRIDDL